MLGSNMNFAEAVNVCGGFSPVNMATAANNGDWVSLANYGRCTVLFYKAAGAAGEPPTITIQQATSNAGANAKALNITRYYSKRGAALTAIGTWTQVDQTAANTILVGTAGAAGDHEAIIAVDVMAEWMDTNNSFIWLQASVADVGATSQIGGLLYLLWAPKFVGATAMPSPL